MEENQLLLILSRDNSDKEIEQIISQLNINYEVNVANEGLSMKWKKLNDETTINYYSNIVAVVNRKGNVEKVLDPHCNECAPVFWNWVKDRIYSNGGK